MTEREIVGVVWHTVSHQIEIVYASGAPEHLEGPHQLAASLAADAGLELVPARGGTVSWMKPDPGRAAD